MSDTLKRLERKFRLHNVGSARHPVAGPDGCIAFVVDRRCVVKEYGEIRLAVSYGDNPFPLERGRGVLCPAPMAGPHCFLVHVVGTRDNTLRVYDMRYDGRPADGPLTADEAAEKAKEILASIPDDQYLRSVADGPKPFTCALSVIEELPLEGYTFLADEEQAPAR